MTSAAGEPPGSRVSTTSMPTACSRAPSSAEWVDLPVPSPPSKVMNRPRISPLAGSVVIAAQRKAKKPGKKALPAASGACAGAGGALEAGAEQADHELGGGIESASRHRS